MKKKIITIVGCIITTFILYYFMLPAINLTNPSFYNFMLLNIVIWVISWISLNTKKELIIVKEKKLKPTSLLNIIILGIAGAWILITLINIIFSPFFNSEMYYKRIEVSDGEFATEISPVDFENLAILDRDSSIKLGDKVMGQATDFVSQFEVSNIYTQLSVGGEILRATPLEYADFFKYLSNKDEGIKAYITVNSVDGSSELVKLEEGMKYMSSAILNEDLMRKLRFSYPTEIFGNINFEIDEDMNPYWIVETIKYKGVGLMQEVDGVIVLDPVTGKSNKYDINEVPEWIDRVYNPSLVMEQLDDWGKYKNGFINSIFGQKEVTQSTDGYNYLTINGDIHMYTGITSVASDDSNIGFVLTNLRTKETKFYNEAGTIENSAMASAEGQVQNLGYVSTFPLLVNLNEKPTYVVSLKDNAGLVKMYGFIDYTNHQKVVTTDSSLGLEKAAMNYLDGEVNNSELEEIEITIDDITTGVIDGNTYYYIMSDKILYKASLSDFENVFPFINKGDKLKIKFIEGKINQILEIIE